ITEVPFYNIVYKRSAGATSTYQVRTKSNLYQFDIALDSANKIQTFFARPWSDDAGSASKYKRQQVMITMRDGIKLNTVIFTPTEQSEPLPFILERTPYGVSDNGPPDRNGYIRDMANDGYIFVFQDIRGRYESEGKFEMQRFNRDKKDPKAIDESTDT